MPSRPRTPIPESGPGPLDRSGCGGCRDLGGTPVAGGRTVLGGALLRCGSQHGLRGTTGPAPGAGAVSRIVDLRWAWECEQSPSPFLGHPVYRHVPMLDDVLGYDPPPDSYAPMLDHNSARIARAFCAVAQAPPGPVVVHCTAGRDRTGVLVALLLQVAGAGAEATAADYAVSGNGTAPMLNTLDHLQSRYGGAAPYLRAAGVAEVHLAAVRKRLLG